MLIFALAYMMSATYSRGAVVGAAAGLCYTGLATFCQRDRRDKQYRFVKIASVFTVLLLLVWIKNDFWNRLSPVYIVSDPSIGNRLVVWQAAMHAIVDGPVFGWGFGQSGNVYRDIYQSLADTNVYMTPVSSLLTLGVEFGAWTIILYLAVVSYLPIMFITKRHCFAGITYLALNACAASGVVLGVCNMFSTLGLGILLPALYIILSTAFVFVAIIDLLHRQYFIVITVLSVSFTVFVVSYIWVEKLSAPNEYCIKVLAAEHIVLTRNSAALGPKRFTVALFADPSLCSRYIYRDVRSFLSKNEWISSCNITKLLTRQSLPDKISEDILIVMGDWVPVLMRDHRLDGKHVIILYPNIRSRVDNLDLLIRPEIDVKAIVVRFGNDLEYLADWYRKNNKPMRFTLANDFKELVLSPDNVQ